MNVQAVHQLHAMVLDGLWADLQDRGDLLGVLAFGDELKDFTLPARQRFERAFLVGNPFQRKPFEESRGDFLRQVNFFVNHTLQDRFGLFGSSLGLLRSDFCLICARLRHFCPGFGLLRARLRQFRPGFGLLRARLRLHSPGFSLLNPRLNGGCARGLFFFLHFAFIIIGRKTSRA